MKNEVIILKLANTVYLYRFNSNLLVLILFFFFSNFYSVNFRLYYVSVFFEIVVLVVVDSVFIIFDLRYGWQNYKHDYT